MSQFLLLLTILLTAQLLCLRVAGYRFSGTVYTAPQTQAYTWSASYPQSCVCMENAVALSSCSLFQCQCACDVTAGVCDYGCCCDPDCSAAQQARFGTVGSCPSSYSSNNVPLCYSSMELYKINPRLPLSGQPTAEAAVAGALCISKYNYATKQEYYSKAPTQTSSIFQQSAGQKPYSYGDTTPVVATIDSNFDKGNEIAAFTTDGTSSTTLYPKGNGFFSVPLPDFSGQCNNNNAVGFESPVQPTSCVRKVDASAATCTVDLAVQTITRTYIATSASIRASAGAATTANTVQVTLGTVMYQNPWTGKQDDRTASFIANLCTTTQLGASTTLAAGATCNFATNANGAPTAITVSSSTDASVCHNVVKQVSYVVNHAGDASSAITSVTANIVITDLPIPNFAALVSSASTTAPQVWDSASDGFVQTFGVDFIGAFTGTAVSSSTGNLVARARSGNPGYILGKPVVFGLLSQDGLVVNEQIAGLVVPSPINKYVAPTTLSVSTYPFSSGGGLSECPSSTSGFGHTPISFGYDMSTGCTLTLSRSDFKTFCGATSMTTYTGSTGLPKFFDFVNGYVGAFGNADPLDPTQWIPISLLSSSPSRQFTDATGICTGVPSGLSYKFLVANAGERAFPQSKIISAQVEVIYSNWVYSVPYLDTTSTQSFPLTITVSFVFSNQQALTGYAPPAPPVLFKVPYDVFYPFYMSPAAPSAAAFSPLAVLAPLVCSLLLVVFGTRI